jgi:uncharacterized protein (DUF983 family)
MEVLFRRTVARCPKCHEGTQSMWIGLHPGEPCPKCGEALGFVDGDPRAKGEDGEGVKEPESHGNI